MQQLMLRAAWDNGDMLTIAGVTGARGDNSWDDDIAEVLVATIAACYGGDSWGEGAGGDDS